MRVTSRNAQPSRAWLIVVSLLTAIVLAACGGEDSGASVTPEAGGETDSSANEPIVTATATATVDPSRRLATDAGLEVVRLNEFIRYDDGSEESMDGRCRGTGALFEEWWLVGCAGAEPDMVAINLTDGSVRTYSTEQTSGRGIRFRQTRPHTASTVVLCDSVADWDTSCDIFDLETGELRGLGTDPLGRPLADFGTITGHVEGYVVVRRGEVHHLLDATSGEVLISYDTPGNYGLTLAPTGNSGTPFVTRTTSTEGDSRPEVMEFLELLSGEPAAYQDSTDQGPLFGVTLGAGRLGDGSVFPGAGAWFLPMLIETDGTVAWSRREAQPDLRVVVNDRRAWYVEDGGTLFQEFDPLTGETIGEEYELPGPLKDARVNSRYLVALTGNQTQSDTSLIALPPPP